MMVHFNKYGDATVNLTAAEAELLQRALAVTLHECRGPAGQVYALARGLHAGLGEHKDAALRRRYLAEKNA